MRITQAHKTTWGSYGDRKDSFDDDKDVELFVKMIHSNLSLQEYIKPYIPKGTFSFRPKPNGTYGVDLGMFSEQNELVATIDIERWSAWDKDWPFYYKHIHFLERKEKFLNQYDKPFFMAFLNYSRDKVLMIDKDSINKYPTIDKYFQYKGVTDRVRELPMSEGHVFGTNLTVREKEHFQ